MTTVTASPTRPAGRPFVRPPGAAGERPDPPLAVLVQLGDGDVALAAARLRPAPALVLGADAPGVWSGVAPGGWTPAYLEHVETLERRRADELDRAFDAAAAAGFDVRAAETVPSGGLPARLRRLARGPAVVVASGGAWRARRLARAAQAPVLAFAPGDVRAGGPAVVTAADARACVAVVARALATDELVIAGRPSPAGEAARALAEELGLRTQTVGDGAPDVVRIAADRGGVVVSADAGGWRAPRALRRGLRAGLPVLLVPERGARR